MATNEALVLQLREHLEELFGNCTASEDGSALTVTVDRCAVSVQARKPFDVSTTQEWAKSQVGVTLVKEIKKATKFFMATMKPDVFEK